MLLDDWQVSQLIDGYVVEWRAGQGLIQSKSSIGQDGVKTEGLTAYVYRSGAEFVLTCYQRAVI
jgi:hypothetical protein